MSRLRQVFLAIPSIGLAAALALYGVSDDEMTDAVIDASVTLRAMGRTPDQIVDLIVAESGAARDEVEPVVRLAVGSVGRDPRSLRTVSLAVLVDADKTAEAVEAYAQAFCAPLLEFADATNPVVAECLDKQRQASGVAQCVDGVLAGYLIKSPATPPQTALAHQWLDPVSTVLEVDPAPELAARGWGACPEPEDA
jgi:hypothetical protein